jgi:predicted 3-demethylubiquinone-9 3-methyltransferase (glyoxalase superfamily)
MSRVTPFIWFVSSAEEAMNYYASVFPDSRVIAIERYAGDQGIPGEQELQGKVLNGTFEIMGQQFMCLDGGEQPGFELSSGAISFLVEFGDQESLDATWDKLMDGGKPQQCGWITDKFGITWQITPKSLGEMMADPTATPEQKQALMKAMMPMVKLESSKLEEAFRSAGA